VLFCEAVWVVLLGQRAQGAHCRTCNTSAGHACAAWVMGAGNLSPSYCSSETSGAGSTAKGQTSVHQLPCLAQPQCMQLNDLGYRLKTSGQMPLGQQNYSAH
jgi:hypothetical protein